MERWEGREGKEGRRNGAKVKVRSAGALATHPDTLHASEQLSVPLIGVRGSPGDGRIPLPVELYESGFRAHVRIASVVD